ncbi:cadherin repeat domain-containing protein [Bradyrhizobium murdochi]|uniref:cadherin repeat domain-containing protein n=1 Tax=Bradyrhizobium murdochi TaxID=1038859 RepID=UPI00040B4C36|nr:cadherin repeat domain-containing protein [Bradyrhizobium murdochi]
MRFGVGVRFPLPGVVQLVGRAFVRSRAGVVAGGKVSLSGKATTRQASRPGLGSVPVIASTSFSIATNPGFNALIGQVVATNSPTSFAIIAGNPSGFFSITNGGSLRTGTSAAPPDNNYSLTITASNSFGTSPPKSITVTVGAAPVVSDQSMNLTIPAASGDPVGTVAVSAGTPTGFSITAGNSSGYFAINNTGDITVTSAGASGITAQSYPLTVQAANALGNDTGVVTVVAATASQTPAIPMSLNDSRFASNTNGPTSIQTAANLINRQWMQGPAYASGEPIFYIESTGTQVINMIQCRADCREGPRLGLAPTATFNVDQCFINCIGKPPVDHADAFQAFGGGGNVNITNSCIRAYTDSEANSLGSFIGSGGFFWADAAQGTITFDNCLFWGGERMIAIYADVGTTTNVRMRNCFFATPFPFETGYMYDIRAVPGGTLNILEWTNNRRCTISGGVIVPGTILPPP